MALVITFEVQLSNMEKAVVGNAVDYVIADDGSLIFRANGIEVFAYPADEWVEVHRVGVGLATLWPPTDLEQLLRHLAWDLCVRFGFCGPAFDPADWARFENPAMNDFDSFVDAVLDQVGVDGTSSSNRALRNHVAAAVATFFSMHTN